MKKILATICTITLAVGTLAGCGNSSGTSVSSEAGDAASATSEEVKNIEFLSQKREDVELFDGLLQEYNAAHPGIAFQQTTTTGSVNFASRVASADLPDLCHVYGSKSYQTMAAEGLFVDLRGHSFLDKIPQEYLDIFTLEDGQIWGVPVSLNTVSLYINNDIYDQYGLEIPRTFDELIANCEVLKENGVNPFVFPFKEPSAIRQTIERWLVGSVDHDYLQHCEDVGWGDASWGDYPKMVKGYEAWLELMEQTDVNPLGTGTDEMINAFANGECAMIMNGVASLNQVVSTNPDLNFQAYLMPSPTGIEAVSVGAPDMILAISKDSEYIDECLEFLDWFLSDEVIEKFAEGDMLPTIVDGVTYRNPYLTEICEGIDDGKFMIAPTTYWVVGYQDAFQGTLQDFIMNKDVTAYIKTLDDVTKDVYGQSPKE